MISAVYHKSPIPNQTFYIAAEEQTWDDATLKELRDKYNIFFNSHGVRPVMLVPSSNKEGCCVVIGSEDDGVIKFRRDMFGNFMDAMSPHWIEDLIKDLTDAKEYVANGGKV